jgi:hypothetical protein
MKFPGRFFGTVQIAQTLQALTEPVFKNKVNFILKILIFRHCNCLFALGANLSSRSGCSSIHSCDMGATKDWEANLTSASQQI